MGLLIQLWQVVVLALVQGVTELFPVSSLGHAVILPDLLGWNIRQDDETWLPFLVVMHLGTAVALLLYFWRDWFDFAMAVLANRGPRPTEERRLFWRVVAATLPAVIAGAALEKVLRHVFASPSIACAFLVLNGLMLFVADRMKRSDSKSIDALTWTDALIIGVMQCLALIPGISRSGATMVGGYRVGLNHEDAARFSFLTATPIIIGATVFELPKLLKNHAKLGGHMLQNSVIAGAVAGVAAFISVWVLMRWFKQHEVKGFTPFAVYCVAAGALALGWKLLH
jgi:undecaprenyl-diphosphatase